MIWSASNNKRYKSATFRESPRRSNARQRKIALPVLALAILMTASARAQVSRTGANLEGTVTDLNGGSVAGAEVRVRNTESGLTRSLETNEEGFFRASEIPVGLYAVSVSKGGFAPYLHTALTLTVGETVRLDIRLTPARIVQHMTVTSQPSAINPQGTSVTTTVGRERIEELPVRTRNALDFVLLAPGVTRSNNAQAMGSQSAGLPGSGFSFAGLRPRSNSLSIDGLENDDEFSGGSRTELSPEIVQEFQVVNNGLSPEYGGGSGGSIDVITRSGANVSHGDAFVFYQNGGTNARQPVETDSGRMPLTRYRAGLSRGGPIVKNRTFYYVALEQEHLRSEEGSDIAAQTAVTIDAFLDTGVLPRLATRRLATGFFPVAFSETETSAKLNHELSSRHSLMLRYAFTNSKKPGNAFNVGGLNDASAAGSSFTRDNSLAGALTSLLSSNAVNEARFQIARRNVTLRTNDAAGPGVEIVGVAEFGRPYAGNSTHREDHYDLSDVLAFTRGPNLFKLGGSAMFVHVRAFEPDGFGGFYTFPNLTNFLAGRPEAFRQAFGEPQSAFDAAGYSGFFQDHRTLNRRTTIDLGLRYDLAGLPQSFNSDLNDFSPRVGVAYSPSGRWVIRAGYGIFFDRYVLENLNRAIAENGNRGFDQVLTGPAAAGVFGQAAGGALAVPLTGIPVSIFRAAPKLATPYSQQSSLGVEYLLSKNFTLRGNFLFVLGIKLPRTVNVNLGSPTVLTPANAAALGILMPTPQQIGREVFGPGRLNPRFNDVEQIQDSASSTYNGLSISIERHTEDFTLSASYTLSKTTDDASDFSEQPQNPYNLRDEWAPSLEDQRQRFVLSGLFQLPLGGNDEGVPTPTAPFGRSDLWGSLMNNIEIAPIITFSSARPVNPLTGLDSNRSDTFPVSSRPLGLGRNSLRTSALENLDLRILKSVYFSRPVGSHLDLVAEAFNFLNHTNVDQINSCFGPDLSPLAGFAQPTAAQYARQIEFSLDFEF
jgi:Carboxypeptidase regulatory-like domain/TonB dependent receptor-like, beta-barrel/TonB-dependent Receptor Plug Domain